MDRGEERGEASRPFDSKRSTCGRLTYTSLQPRRTIQTNTNASSDRTCKQERHQAGSREQTARNMKKPNQEREIMFGLGQKPCACVDIHMPSQTAFTVVIRSECVETKGSNLLGVAVEELLRL